MGLADAGLGFLIFLGPVGGVFRSSIFVASVGLLLLLIAVLLYRRVLLEAFMGIVWALCIVVLLGITMSRISVSYSLAARLLLFGPALSLNIGLLFALCSRSVLLGQRSPRNVRKIAI